MDELNSAYEKGQYLQNLLLMHATGGDGNDQHYKILRDELVRNENLKEFIPSWLRVNRDLSQFWMFIKNRFKTYQERRSFLTDELAPLLSYLESGDLHPARKSIDDILKAFDVDSIHYAWTKALSRKINDPEGAITISRSMLESTCKHILDRKGIEYNSLSVELPELYKKTAKALNLASEQHSELIYKQILGGCSGIVSGLGSLRNKLGDAHGQGKNPVKPQARHAELAVNLAGAMSLFLISTYNNSCDR
ncbi:abortive infection family protein [Cobetia sp. cqz5-12]|uniref:abortive infection family protein n=1 Tax=Cobetia sp. cqz5-12 TaxID=2609415 RepID=UPI001937C03A|nr:abortive infection family protein [Cobetia sp. cqz5-12]QQK65046.1 abortive infection family protein [Cobetia sp. cqz5-12]